MLPIEPARAAEAIAEQLRKHLLVIRQRRQTITDIAGGQNPEALT